MTANLLVIKERKRPDPFAVADPADFAFEVGETIDPQMVMTNPRITLYCLDHANQRALFVETALGVDLSTAPFFYQAQYENTVNLYGVSYDTLHQLAAVLEKDSQAGSAVSQDMVAQHDFELTDAHRADFAQVLQAHPVIHSGDYIVPATWVRE